METMDIRNIGRRFVRLIKSRVNTLNLGGAIINHWILRPYSFFVKYSIVYKPK